VDELLFGRADPDDEIMPVPLPPSPPSRDAPNLATFSAFLREATGNLTRSSGAV
jgi:hypothetical protein